jgi:hypothetical protein
MTGVLTTGSEGVDARFASRARMYRGSGPLASDPAGWRTELNRPLKN